MNQQVIITLRGTADLKKMLVTLSELKHEPMNVVVQDLIKKEYEDHILNVSDAEIDPLQRTLDDHISFTTPFPRVRGF